MRVVALVPFKCFTRAKQRLRQQFSDAQVEAIGRAMLEDVLYALRDAPGLEQVRVLTDDDAVAEAAEAAGARVRLRSPDPGLNAAIDQAAAEAADEGFDASLVALGDLPLLRPDDVALVLEQGLVCPVAIVPSNDGGTAMLYRRPCTAIPARFGEKSAERHMQTARDAELRCEVISAGDSPTGLDLDTPEDIERLLASGRSCRTRDVLVGFSQ
jgi:2-phospho-L-lactate guanylyltransferase